MVMIDVGTPKMARELLCRVSTGMEVTDPQYILIERMIAQLDVHRPLGDDGKHGDLHTVTCGCDLSIYAISRDIFRNSVIEVEKIVWSDETVTYQHRNRVWDGSDRWTHWKPGKGEE